MNRSFFPLLVSAILSCGFAVTGRAAEPDQPATSSAIPSPAPYEPDAPEDPPALSTSKVGDKYTVAVQSIVDNRVTPGTGSLVLNLTAAGPELGTSTFARQTNLTKATDDAGRNLATGARSGLTAFAGLLNSGRLAALFRGGLGSTVSAPVYLGPPARNAKAVALVEGTVEFYSPSEANGSLIFVKSALNRAGKPLDNAALAKEGIEFVILTPEVLPAFQTRAGIVSGAPLPANSVATYVRDPHGKLAGYVFLEANDQPIAVGTVPAGTARGGDGGTIAIQSMPSGVPKDLQVALFVITPDSLLTLPFKFENLPLP